MAIREYTDAEMKWVDEYMKPENWAASLPHEHPGTVLNRAKAAMERHRGFTWTWLDKENAEFVSTAGWGDSGDKPPLPPRIRRHADEVTVIASPWHGPHSGEIVIRDMHWHG